MSTEDLVESIDRLVEGRDNRHLFEGTIAGMSEQDIIQKWNEGNNQGEGFDPSGESVMPEKWSKLGETGQGDKAITVYELADGGVVGVGDDNGPWAVRLSGNS